MFVFMDYALRIQEIRWLPFSGHFRRVESSVLTVSPFLECSYGFMFPQQSPTSAETHSDYA